MDEVGEQREQTMVWVEKRPVPSVQLPVSRVQCPVPSDVQRKRALLCRFILFVWETQLCFVCVCV